MSERPAVTRSLDYFCASGSAASGRITLGVPNDFRIADLHNFIDEAVDDWALTICICCAPKGASGRSDEMIERPDVDEGPGKRNIVGHVERDRRNARAKPF